MRHTIYNYPDLSTSFIKIPRAASRTIMRGVVHGRVEESSEIKFKSFAVVRNPYDRFKSAMFMFTFGPFAERHPDLDATVPGLIDIVDDDAIRPERDRKAWFLKWHFLPMKDPYFQLEKADRVFRFERLKDDWPEMARFVGLDHVPPMQHLGAHDEVIELSHRDRDMIYERFRADFEAFGYERAASQ